MKIIFVAGGTGGHINPAIAMASTIKHKHNDAQISFIGNRFGMEADLVPKAGFEFYSIDVAGFQRKISVQNIKRNADALKKMFLASKQAEKILKEVKPDLVVGTGGFTCGPVLRKASKLGIKTATHEQNAFPGITTKALCKYVDVVMLAMADAKDRLPKISRYVITGNPVRQSVLEMDKKTAREILKLDDRPMILSLGGSLGARAVNEAVAGVLKWHAKSEKYYHFHAYGKYGKFMVDLLHDNDIKFEEMANLRISEYIYDMDVVMAAADLVINRAGASTISELEIKGKPSILIPSPNVAENHQFYNAKTLSDNGAAVLIEEKDLSQEKLIDTVDRLINDSQKLDKMSKKALELAVFDANEKIYQTLMDLYISTKN